jgi:hypothetical protein
MRDGPDAAGLGHGDHVQGGVDCAVAAAVEPHLPTAVARPDRDRGGPGESSVGIARAEPVRSGRLTKDHRRAENSAPRDGQQPRCHVADQGAELGFQGVDLLCELVAAVEELAREPGDDTVEDRELLGQLGDDPVAAQPAGGHV